ncbi:hypothetical protein HY58_03490 [Flavihumibacter sp. ZG627]|nr:hypothetical protein HY58_03490 [Flavihumibacter sp. ZG627]
MQLILVPNIFYEVVTESCEGQIFSEFFTLPNLIESREAAINKFLELVLEEPKADETFVTLYLRYLKTGERLELLNTATYEHPGETLKALERELFLFQKENLATNVAIFNHEKFNHIIILFPRFKNSYLLVNPSTSVLIASMYWVFLKKKKERFLVE